MYIDTGCWGQNNPLPFFKHRRDVNPRFNRMQQCMKKFLNFLHLAHPPTISTASSPFCRLARPSNTTITDAISPIPKNVTRISIKYIILNIHGRPNHSAIIGNPPQTGSRIWSASVIICARVGLTSSLHIADIWVLISESMQKVIFVSMVEAPPCTTIICSRHSIVFAISQNAFLLYATALDPLFRTPPLTRSVSASSDSFPTYSRSRPAPPLHWTRHHIPFPNQRAGGGGQTPTQNTGIGSCDPPPPVLEAHPAPWQNGGLPIS